MRKRIQCLLIVLLLTGAAWAHDPAGWWSSSSGSTIKLWANMQQVIVTVHTPQGQKFQYSGAWQRFGDTFTYYVPNGGNYFVRFNGRNHLVVTGPNGSITNWYRR